jgi:hypothetical protein
LAECHVLEEGGIFICDRLRPSMILFEELIQGGISRIELFMDNVAGDRRMRSFNHGISIICIVESVLEVK